MEWLGQSVANNFSAVWIGVAVALGLAELALAPKDRADPGGWPRLVTNFSLALLSAIVAAAFPLGSIGAALLAERHGWGLFAETHATPLIAVLLALAARTFANYWLHRASHAWTPLWRLHRVHHSDTQFDFSLGVRHHPIEVIPQVAVFAGGVVLLGLPVYAVALAEALALAGGLWEHLDISLPPRVDRRLCSVFVTPLAHSVHHSTIRAQCDSNYGGVFSVWDRLFGTWRDPERARPAHFGLPGMSADAAANLRTQLALPLAPVRRAAVEA